VEVGSAVLVPSVRWVISVPSSLVARVRFIFLLLLVVVVLQLLAQARWRRAS
jgi:hypothetical protein